MHADAYAVLKLSRNAPKRHAGTFLERRNAIPASVCVCGSVAEWLGRWTCDQ